MSDIPQAGEFPFRITNSEQESVCIEHIRDNSSYMRLSGLLNAFTALFVYVRGVLGNLLIVSPILIFVGVIIGVLHFRMLENPFWLSRWMTAIGLIGALVYFPIFSADSRIAFPQSYFGWLFMLLVMAGVIEVSPILIEYFRDHAVFRVFGFKEVSSIVVSIATLAGVVFKYLPSNGSLRRKILFAVLAVLGFALIWLVTLVVANFVAYGLPPHGVLLRFPGIGLGVFTGLAVFYVLGLQALRWWQQVLLALLTIAVGIGLYFSAISWITGTISENSDYAAAYIGTMTRPLRRVIDGANTPAKESGLSDDSLENRKLTAMFARWAGTPKDTTETMKTVSIEVPELSTELTESLRKLDGDIRLLDLQANAQTFFRSEVEQKTAAWYAFAAPPGDSAFDPEYFRSAATFLERAERVRRRVQLTEYGSLLDKLSITSRNQVLRLPALKSSFDGKAFECLVAMLSGQHELERRLRADDLFLDKLEASNFDNDRNAILTGANASQFWQEVRVPVALADAFLQVTGRGDARKTFVGRSGPDAAKTGPKIEPKFENIVYVDGLGQTVAEGEKTRPEADGLLLLRKRVGSKAFDFIFAAAVMSSLPLSNAQHYYEKIEDRFAKVEFRFGPESGKACSISPNHRLQSILKSRADEKSIERQLQTALLNENVAHSQELLDRLAVGPTETNITQDEVEKRKREATDTLLEVAISGSHRNRKLAVELLGELYDPAVPIMSRITATGSVQRTRIARELYIQEPGKDFKPEQLHYLLAASFVEQDRFNAEQLLRRMVFGRYGNLEGLDKLTPELYSATRASKLWFIAPVGLILLLISRAFINVNSTSLHAFYRDRLADAFLFRVQQKRVDGVSKIRTVAEKETKISEIADYDNRSIAPYSLINAAINITNNKQVRSRNADFFLFSKLFVGGPRTGYLATTAFEANAPEITLSSTMAISGAAVSSNMGKYSNSVLNFFLCLLNVRLGYWIFNPKYGHPKRPSKKPFFGMSSRSYGNGGAICERASKIERYSRVAPGLVIVRRSKTNFSELRCPAVGFGRRLSIWESYKYSILMGYFVKSITSPPSLAEGISVRRLLTSCDHRQTEMLTGILSILQSTPFQLRGGIRVHRENG